MEQSDFDKIRGMLQEQIRKIRPGPEADGQREFAEMCIAGVGILERFVVAIEMLSIQQPKG